MSLDYQSLQFTVLLVGAAALILLVVKARRQPKKSGLPPPQIVASTDQRLRTLISNSSDLMLVTNADGTIRYLSPSVTRVLGYDEKSLWAPSILEFVHPQDVADVRKLLAAAAREISGLALRGEWRLKDNRGKWMHVEGVVTNHLGEPGIGGLLLNIRDVTERKLLEQKLVHQALHDPLTGLANRTLLMTRAEEVLRGAREGGGGPALLFLDLDDFKQVNDTLGHAAGDHLLQEIAMRLQSTCRAVDTVARLGGDEFAVLLKEAGVDDAVQVAERILYELRSPYAMLKGRRPSTSIGIALFDRGASADELVRRADVAMYAAKAAGKNGFRVFSPEMDEPLRQRIRLEADLRGAVQDWQLSVHYQPIIDLGSGQTMGVEALLRWNHPFSGRLTGEQFLPLAERIGLMWDIGRRVIGESCLEVASWRRLSERPQPFLSINVSGEELRQGGLVREIQNAIDSSSLSHDLLVVEISEKVLKANEGDIKRRISELGEIGVRVAIDDFGTHYASLSYLKDLPCDFLKLDKSFVSEITTQPKAFHIVRVMVDLAESLGIGLIAEGIEQAEHHEAVLALGCRLGQGYYYSPALPPYEMREKLHGADGRKAGDRSGKLPTMVEPGKDPKTGSSKLKAVL